MIRKLIKNEELKEVHSYWNQITNEELDLDLFWDPTLDQVPSRFEITRSDRIFLNKNCNIKTLIPAIAHEKTHRKQFKTLGWITYSFMNRFTPFLLNFFAKRAENRIAKRLSLEPNFQ